jgi:hypothetical protein
MFGKRSNSLQSPEPRSEREPAPATPPPGSRAAEPRLQAVAAPGSGQASVKPERKPVESVRTEGASG